MDFWRHGPRAPPPMDDLCHGPRAPPQMEAVWRHGLRGGNLGRPPRQGPPSMNTNAAAARHAARCCLDDDRDARRHPLGHPLAQPAVLAALAGLRPPLPPLSSGPYTPLNHRVTSFQPCRTTIYRGRPAIPPPPPPAPHPSPRSNWRPAENNRDDHHYRENSNDGDLLYYNTADLCSPAPRPGGDISPPSAPDHLHQQLRRPLAGRDQHLTGSSSSSSSSSSRNSSGLCHRNPPPHHRTSADSGRSQTFLNASLPMTMTLPTDGDAVTMMGLADGLQTDTTGPTNYDDGRAGDTTAQGSTNDTYARTPHGAQLVDRTRPPPTSPLGHTIWSTFPPPAPAAPGLAADDGRLPLSSFAPFTTSQFGVGGAGTGTGNGTDGRAAYAYGQALWSSPPPLRLPLQAPPSEEMAGLALFSPTTTTGPAPASSSVLHMFSPPLQSHPPAAPPAPPAPPPPPPPPPTPEAPVPIVAYCFNRGNGLYTRLVPADTLPPLRGLPPLQRDCRGMVVLVDPLAGTGIPAPVYAVADAQTGAPAPTRNPQMRHAPLPPPTAPAAAGAAPARRHKVYCDKWVHEGICAFTQQGCKFKHEMPHDRPTQRTLGLFHGYPTWYKKMLDEQGQQGQGQQGQQVEETKTVHEADGPTTPRGGRGSGRCGRPGHDRSSGGGSGDSSDSGAGAGNTGTGGGGGVGLLGGMAGGSWRTASGSNASNGGQTGLRPAGRQAGSWRTRGAGTGDKTTDGCGHDGDGSGGGGGLGEEPQPGKAGQDYGPIGPPSVRSSPGDGR